MKENFWFAFTAEKNHTVRPGRIRTGVAPGAVQRSRCYSPDTLYRPRRQTVVVLAEADRCAQSLPCHRAFMDQRKDRASGSVGQPGITKASDALLPHCTNTRCSGIHLTISNALSMMPFINWEVLSPTLACR